MFEESFTRLTDMLIANDKCKAEDREIIIYGLIIGVELFFNLVTLFILGVFFDMIIESIVFYVSYSCLRTYAGGYHCEKAINCYIVSSCIIVFVLAMVKWTPSEYLMQILLAILIFGIPAIFILAPVPARNKPLDEVEFIYYKKKARYRMLAECVAIAILAAVELHTLAYTIALSIAVIATVVLLEWSLRKLSSKKAIL